MAKTWVFVRPALFASPVQSLGQSWPRTSWPFACKISVGFVREASDCAALALLWKRMI